MRAGARLDGEWISGEPVTEGFDSVRMPATGIGIGLRLEDGQVAWGDAISVQYPGVADRDPPLLAARYIPQLAERLAPALAGLETDGFRDADSRAMQALADGSLSHKAIEYGLSQALLVAAARSSGRTMAEVVCAEFDCPLVAEPVPVFAQTGDRNRDNADKMIMKRVDAIPHGLINIAASSGREGEAFLEYVGWLTERIRQLAPAPATRPHCIRPLRDRGPALRDDPHHRRLISPASPQPRRRSPCGSRRP